MAAIKQEELDYMRRALEALGAPDTTLMAQAKILRTLSQIADRASREIEMDLVDKTNERLYNTQTNKGA